MYLLILIGNYFKMIHIILKHVCMTEEKFFCTVQAA
uniref:Uncharacterized protein n=1 Tax=Arundo donax TaxID=35708 RepID=A0A0A8ZSK0_ARUDO